MCLVCYRSEERKYKYLKCLAVRRSEINLFGFHLAQCNAVLDKLLGMSYLSSWKCIVRKGMADVVCGIVTRLPAGWSKGLNLGNSEEFFSATKRRDHVYVHTASCPEGTAPLIRR